MNCKPGDLAIFVRCEFGLNNGRIVRVVAASKGHFRPDAKAWLVENEGATPLLGRIYPSGLVGELRSFLRAYDDELRAIRPGDISDEEVRDLYAPKVPEAA